MEMATSTRYVSRWGRDLIKDSCFTNASFLSSILPKRKRWWFSLRPRAGIACASMENAKKIRNRVLTIIFYWKNRASWTPRLWILSPTYRPYVLAHRVWEGITRTCPSVFPRLRRLKGTFKIACLTLGFREHIRNDSISPSFDFVWQ